MKLHRCASSAPSAEVSKAAVNSAIAPTSASDSGSAKISAQTVASSPSVSNAGRFVKVLAVRRTEAETTSLQRWADHPHSSANTSSKAASMDSFFLGLLMFKSRNNRSTTPEGTWTRPCAIACSSTEMGASVTL